MPEALGERRWAAIRAACEGALPTQEQVAAVAGIYVKTLTHKANAQGWATLNLRRPRVRAAHRQMIALAAAAASGEELDLADPDEAGDDASAMATLGEWRDEALPALPQLPPRERAARLRDMIAGRLEELTRRAEAGRPIEGRQVATLTALAQLADRIAPFDPQAEAAERQQRSDEELAVTLRKIDDRIVELARNHAMRILMRTGLSEDEAEAAMSSFQGSNVHSRP